MGFGDEPMAEDGPGEEIFVLEDIELRASLTAQVDPAALANPSQSRALLADSRWAA